MKLDQKALEKRVFNLWVFFSLVCYHHFPMARTAYGSMLNLTLGSLVEIGKIVLENGKKMSLKTIKVSF